MRTASTGAAPGDPRDCGLSLVEVLVAMSVLVVGSLSLLSVLVSTTSGSVDNRARVTAANLAAADIDLVRSRSYNDVVPASTTQTVSGRTYSIVRTVNVKSGTTSSTSACTASASTRDLYKRVTTTVNTTFRGRVQAVRADTLIKAPVYQAPAADKGAIGFLVMDRNSSPLPGLTVNAGGVNVPTDSSGCSFFDNLTPGDQTVTVTRANSVTRASRTPLSKTVRVVAGKITPDSMRVDTSVPVRVNVQVLLNNVTYSAGTSTMPTNLKAQLSSPDRATATRVVAEAAPAVTSAPWTHTWQAFPAAAGYEAHLGRCSSLVHQTFAEPGTTPTQGTFSLTPVAVHMNGAAGDGSKVQSKTVTVRWKAADCAETLHYAAVTTSGCSPNSSGSDQCKFTIAVPPGEWVFTIATPGTPPVESLHSTTFTVPSNPQQNNLPNVVINV